MGYGNRVSFHLIDILPKYVNYFYELKTQNIPLSKLLLNVLWGALCQKKKIKIDKPKDGNIVIPDGTKLIGYRYFEDSGRTDMKYIETRNPYLTPYARLGPFLTSLGKFLTCKHLLFHYNNGHLVRAHTNGWYSKYEAKNKKNSTKLGDLKCDGCEPVVITNIGSRLEEKYKI